MLDVQGEGLVLTLVKVSIPVGYMDGYTKHLTLIPWRPIHFTAFF